MTVRELLATLQQLPRDAELLAFEAGCEEYCEREVDDETTRRAASRLMLAGLRASDCDRMVEAFSLALPGGPPPGS